MATYITFNKDMAEVSRQESDYLPGFERKDDGTFFAIEGDKRIVKEPEEVVEIEEDIPTIEFNGIHPVFQKPHDFSKKNAAPIPKNWQNRIPLMEGNRRIQTSSKRTTVEQFLSVCSKQKIIDMGHSKDLLLVEMKGDCGLPCVPNNGVYAKVCLNTILKSIKFWNVDPLKLTPDMVLLESL